MALFRLIVRIYEALFNCAMRMWPSASERMDPYTRFDYEQRMAAAKEKLDAFKKEAGSDVR